MNATKSQAEAFATGLIEGVVSVSEVVAWADGLIQQVEIPEDWLIALASASHSSPKQVIALLHDVPGDLDHTEANELARALLARKNRPFALFDPTLLPNGFRYPRKLVRFATSGEYPWLPTVWFLDARSSYSEEVLRQVQRVRTDLVPFAHSEDRFPSLSGTEADCVYIVDIVDKTVGRVGSFDEWLALVDADGAAFAYVRV